MTKPENYFRPYVENIGDTNTEINCQILEESNGESIQSIFFKVLSNAILHTLDAFLSAILTPFILWQWLSKHEHVMIMLKVIIEVTLELMMWTIFAVVSILTSAALLYDDWYKCNEIAKTKTRKKEKNPETDIVGEGPNFQRKRTDLKNWRTIRKNF